MFMFLIYFLASFLNMLNMLWWLLIYLGGRPSEVHVWEALHNTFHVLFAAAKLNTTENGKIGPGVH